MRNSIKSYNFFSGGRAVFTVSNPNGEHYTFKINRPSKDKPFFVKLLSGPESFVYMGLFIPEQATIKITKSSKFNNDSLPVKVFRWAVQRIYLNKCIPQGYAIQHEGLCCRCGRALTVPESIDMGIGPECQRILSLA